MIVLSQSAESAWRCQQWVELIYPMAAMFVTSTPIRSSVRLWSFNLKKNVKKVTKEVNVYKMFVFQKNFVIEFYFCKSVQN